MIKNNAFTGPFFTKQKPTLLNWEKTNQQTILGQCLIPSLGKLPGLVLAVY